MVWESWLRGVTPVEEEAVVEPLAAAGGRRQVASTTYAALMEASFVEIARVLKPDAWATVVFHSSDPEVWAALRTPSSAPASTSRTRRYLDKTAASHKGYKGRSGVEDVAAFDVVLNLHKPGRQRRRPKPPGGYSDAGEHDRAPSAPRYRPSAPIADADRQRTLPFLHSLLVQAHFNGSLGLEVGRYALVRRICQERFVCDEAGRW